MNYTENYQLNQWDAGDRVLREDFNADNAKIDAALKAANDTAAGKCRIVTGTYQGDQTDGRMIWLGFTPKLVIVICNNNFINIAIGSYARYGLQLTENGFIVSYNNNNGSCNTQLVGDCYRYAAFA